MLQKIKDRKNNSNFIKFKYFILELKKLKNETEYEQKLSKVHEQVSSKKEEFKKVQKELLKNQKNTQEEHEYLVRLMEENASLKYFILSILIAHKLKENQ